MMLPKALNRRLEEIGYTLEEINELIAKYQIQAEQYIHLMLKDINITLEDSTKELLNENYVQYQLFSMVEMDELVQDKKKFIDDTLKTVISNYWDKKEKELELSKQNKGIMVF